MIDIGSILWRAYLDSKTHLTKFCDLKWSCNIGSIIDIMQYWKNIRWFKNKTKTKMLFTFIIGRDYIWFMGNASHFTLIMQTWKWAFYLNLWWYAHKIVITVYSKVFVKSVIYEEIVFHRRYLQNKVKIVFQ